MANPGVNIWPFDTVKVWPRAWLVSKASRAVDDIRGSIIRTGGAWNPATEREEGRRNADGMTGRKCQLFELCPKKCHRDMLVKERSETGIFCAKGSTRRVEMDNGTQ